MKTVDEVFLSTGHAAMPDGIVVSAFVGLVTLSGVVYYEDPGKWAKDPWFRGPFGFVLTHPWEFEVHIETKGKLKLWRPPIAAVRKLPKMLRNYILVRAAR